MTRRSPDDPISRPTHSTNRFPIHEWEFTEAEYITDDLGGTESLFAVGNGYLGMRGNVEEGRETYTTARSSTASTRRGRSGMPKRPSASREWARPSSMPDNKTIKLYVDDEPMLLSVADLESRTHAGLP